MNFKSIIFLCMLVSAAVHNRPSDKPKLVPTVSLGPPIRKWINESKRIRISLITWLYTLNNLQATELTTYQKHWSQLKLHFIEQLHHQIIHVLKNAHDGQLFDDDETLIMMFLPLTLHTKNRLPDNIEQIIAILRNLESTESILYNKTDVYEQNRQ